MHIAITMTNTHLEDAQHEATYTETMNTLSA